MTVALATMANLQNYLQYHICNLLQVNLPWLLLKIQYVYIICGAQMDFPKDNSHNIFL